MLDQIQTTLTDYSQRDRRLHYCQLDVERLENNQCGLSGAILDAPALTEVLDELHVRFPEIAFNASQVQLLSQPGMKKSTVATNISGLMAEPSWRSEQMSQLFNGWEVEILLERDEWVFVRQAQDNGYLGWVYRNYLSDEAPPAATHVVYTPIGLLHEEPSEDSGVIGRVFAGMGVAVTAVSGEWAQVTLAGGLAGWLASADLRNRDTLPQTEAERRQQIVDFACQLMGVPYSWGGRSALGIDCSGFAELAYRLAGINIPRDADMQFAAGTEIETPFKPGDLLFFGSDRGHRSVSHVAISLGGWRVVHSGRLRNGVYIDDVQAAPYLRDIYLGARTFVP